MNWFTYLSRLPRSRGFGVQSPTDYHFLRHVIRQKNPYYAYNDLAPQTEQLSKREVEILHFYLRLANYVQDNGEIIIHCKRPTIDTRNFQQWERNMELRRTFLKAGSRKAKTFITTETPKELPDGTILVIENYNDYRKPITENQLPKTDNRQSIIKLLNDRATVLFDLDDLAVAFVNPKRAKATYKVNL